LLAGVGRPKEDNYRPSLIKLKFQLCPSRSAGIKNTKVLELPHRCCAPEGHPWTHARAIVEDRCCYLMELSILSSESFPGASDVVAKDTRVFTQE